MRETVRLLEMYQPLHRTSGVSKRARIMGRDEIPSVEQEALVGEVVVEHATVLAIRDVRMVGHADGHISPGSVAISTTYDTR